MVKQWNCYGYGRKHAIQLLEGMQCVSSVSAISINAMIRRTAFTSDHCTLCGATNLHNVCCMRAIVVWIWLIACLHGLQVPVGVCLR
jgi:hypothetical protein